MNKIHVVIMLFILLLSCSSRKIIIQPEKMNAFSRTHQENLSYHLIDTNHRKIDFNEFEIRLDTLLVVPTNKYGYASNRLAIPFRKIEKIYVYDYPNHTRNSIIFLSSIISSYLLLVVVAIICSGTVPD